MTKNSFQFGNVNSADEWGLKVVSHDCFMPPKRQRRMTIPGRSGDYDYGSDTFDDRYLVLECVLTRKISKAQLREIIFILSRKDKIRLWDEPEKYYLGELFETDEVAVYPTGIMREFELEFRCYPFAMGEDAIAPLSTGHNQAPYRGTVRAPCVITLRNANSFPITNVTITAIKRRV